jgi:hypothetical protein
MNLDEALLHLKLDGWCVLDGIIPPSQVAAIRQSVQSAVESGGSSVSLAGVGARTGLLAFDQSFSPYLADRRILDVAEALLGKPVRISFTTAIVNYPGNERGLWHADWPFNQNTAGHIPAPYPDMVAHLTTIWMLSSFSPETGGTLVVPGSHRSPDNPTGDNGVDPARPYPTEIHAAGRAGSVLIFDSRLWHSISPNVSDQARVGMAVRYAPWWLNLDVLMLGSVERTRMVDETGINDNVVNPVPRNVYDGLPENVKPLFRHWVAS